MSRVLHRAGATPPVAVGGDGVWLHLADGRRILDGSGGAAVACLGHGNRRVAAAIGAQAARLAYAHTGFFTSEPAEALAEALVGDEPGGLTHAWFCSSGSEATEAALKLARQYHVERAQPERTHVIARTQSYHGNTLGALAAGGNMARRALYQPLLSPAFSHVSPAFPSRCPREGESEAGFVDRLAAELEAEFARLGPETVIAFIAEPVVGATAGCVTAPAGYFRRVREICDRHGALLILDEVMCGLGRCGTRHAWEAEGVAPDIEIIAKGLAGGYQPIGGILIAGHVIAALAAGSGAFLHGHTYQAHPVACAAALEVQRIIAEDGLVARVAHLGTVLEAALTDRFGNHPHVGEIRGRGLFRAIELVADRASRAPFDPARRLHERVKTAALTEGLAVYPMGGTIDGVRGDHVLIAPPFLVTEGEIGTLTDRLGRAVDAALG